jgi:hypothetical protein
MSDLTPLVVVTLEDALKEAIELEKKGDKQPSVKLAVWASALSADMSLSKNCQLARLVARFVTEPLPNQEELFQYLSRATRRLRRNSHMRALARAEELDNLGMLAEFLEFPDEYEQQVAWRDRLHALMTGYGMSWKTCSMVALCLLPTRSHLVPVDRHVLARFGLPGGSPNKRSEYIAVEKMVLDERDRNGHQEVSGLVWHWFKWEEWRQLHGASLAVEGAESHLGLSCRWY